MPSANSTVTAKVGPGVQLTSTVFSNVTALRFDVERSVIEIVYTGLSGRKITVHLDYTGVTTITYTISAGVGTVTIS